MRRRHHLWLLAAICALALHARSTARLEEMRRAASAEAAAAPVLDVQTFVTTTLLAGARAIVVDIAWIRADYYERSGNLWAVAPTLELITQLEPGLEMVWTHIAWHQAFNLSLEEDAADLEARWHWIDAGIRTLERGIARNPRSSKLRLELGGWLLYAKCCRPELDEGAPYFARRYAESRGREAIDDVISTLRAAQSDPRHLTMAVPLCPTLWHALMDRYEAGLARFALERDAATYARLEELRGELAQVIDHLIVDHGMRADLVRGSYVLPELPER